MGLGCGLINEKSREMFEGVVEKYTGLNRK